MNQELKQDKTDLFHFSGAHLFMKITKYITELLYEKLLTLETNSILYIINRKLAKALLTK